MILGIHRDVILGIRRDVILGIRRDVVLGIRRDAFLGIRRDAILGIRRDAILGIRRDVVLGIRRDVVLEIPLVLAGRRDVVLGIPRGSIGITAEDLKPGAARNAKLSPQSGAVITKIQSGSPAARAGLRPGDVVVRLGDRTVARSAFLRNRLALLRVGEAAELSILRDGKPLTVRATVAARDQRPGSK